MLIQIPEVFSNAEAKTILQRLEAAHWVDGKVTTGYQSARVKDNLQLSEDDVLATELGQAIIARLTQNNTFMSAALPAKIYPPLFNNYRGGGTFGMHIDNAIRSILGTRERVRTDVSATLFFSDPDSYEGGELIIDDTYGSRSVKLPAGHMVLYPSTSLHAVTPVTRGARISSFFWMQSLVREDTQRALLFEMDKAVQLLTMTDPEHPSLLNFTGVYHNLLRRWSDV